MKLINKVVLVFIITFISTHAQNKYSIFEIGGNILFSYSNTNSPFGPDDSGFYKELQFQIEPEIGYYVTSNIEILLDLNYTFDYVKNNVFTSYPNNSYTKWIYKTYNHRLGIFGGISYNYHINNTLLLFIGTKIGVSATRYILSNNEPNFNILEMDSGWKYAEITFPAFFCGTKIFLNPSWALGFKDSISKNKSL